MQPTELPLTLHISAGSDEHCASINGFMLPIRILGCDNESEVTEGANKGLTSAHAPRCILFVFTQ
ncbi:hypothetical protein [Neptunomonas phycophila]|uniref:hypothetical protein n=1 Tax=Neptunomonas phycophila TaxID=1572645 RepID=UPI0009490AA4|nr:hypothetical protein [Neptunomonas phycophila]